MDEISIKRQIMPFGNFHAGFDNIRNRKGLSVAAEQDVYNSFGLIQSMNESLSIDGRGFGWSPCRYSPAIFASEVTCV